jgi:glutaminyl-peptide cyclotransferase
MYTKYILTLKNGGLLSLVILIFSHCGTTPNSTESIESESTKLVTNATQKFSEDSTYSFIEKQLSFGYRIPGTPEHKNCADWLFTKLLAYCDTAYFQRGQTKTHKGTTIPVFNLIGSFNPKATKRLLFASHWDSRPFADQDKNNPNKPILAANDGASGVAVLLELARIMDSAPEDIGIDILFFDAEDLGESEFENSFCLGSQYWAKNLHIPNYKAKMGVLLDMVGGKNAEFLWEGNSNQWGNFLLSHIWTIAQELGYSQYFKTQQTGFVTDDHVYVYQGTGIPMIDIIDYHHQRGFPDEWHTHNDNLEHISKSTLKAVGHTLENMINHLPPSFYY